MEKVEASVLGTIYRNDENGWTVLTAREGRREITIVGTLPELHPGEQAAFTGEWISHPTYGRQLKCSAVELQKPTTLLGIERYLGSGIIHGVGPSTAKAIVAHFGEDTLRVLSEHPEMLQEVPKMGKKRWKQIAEAYREQEGARTAMVFLQTYGIPATLSIKISKLYGDRTPAIIKENPYRLCEDIDGVGFLTADRIGTSLGVPPDSEGRICAALKYILREAAASQGHIYLPRKELLSRASQLLRVEPELAEHHLIRMAMVRELVQSGDDGEERIYLPVFEGAEREVALRLCELMAAYGHGGAAGVEREIDKFQKRNKITFSSRQREAIAAANREGVLVITGGPGTGKTTIINCIISLLSQEGEVVLCAPTGRAAKRMTEATGVEAKTIHRLLEYGGDEGQFARNQENPIEADVVIVDEVSMVDLLLMRSLLRAIEPGTRLILVGDADQLPSVGAGNVLGDILQSGAIPSVRLNEIFRQAESSLIVRNAHAINHGEMPQVNLKGSNFFLERKPYAESAAQAIVELCKTRLPNFLNSGDPIRQIQVLAPTKKGACGVNALNVLLQAALNPPSPEKEEIAYGDGVFRTGDKVMHIKNNYNLEWEDEKGHEGQGVFNGDMGTVLLVDNDDKTVTVLFDDDRMAVYEYGMLEELELAYCLSVHKSQGSEFRAVVMPAVGGPPMLLTRNLFYTALTRARELVVLVGREDAIAAMVNNNHIARRYTALSQRLQEMPKVRA